MKPKPTPLSTQTLSEATLRVVSLLLSILLLVILEISLSWLIPKNRLEVITNILREDPQQFWLQKPHLNTDFFGEIVTTNGLGLRNPQWTSSDKEALTILVMGASPSFGWGVADEYPYARVSEKILGKSTERPIRVINGSVIGYSSHQGKNLLPDLLDQYSPDIVTLSYVINDVDRYRFFRNDGSNDRQAKTPSNWSITINNLTKDLGLTQAFRRLLRLATQWRSSNLVNNWSAHLPGEVRVSLQEYRNNLSTMITEIRRRQKQVVLIKMPVNLPRPRISSTAEQKLAAVDEGEVLLEKGAFKEARSFYTQLLSSQPHHHLALLGLARSTAGLGQPIKTQKWRDDLKKTISYQCRLRSEIYNLAMERIGEEQDIPVVDIVTTFAKHSQEYLFLDPNSDTIHPNIRGHQLIAEELSKAIKTLVKSAPHTDESS